MYNRAYLAWNPPFDSRRHTSNAATVRSGHAVGRRAHTELVKDGGGGRTAARLLPSNPRRSGHFNHAHERPPSHGRSGGRRLGAPARSHLASRTCEIGSVLPRPQSVRTSCVRTHVGGELFIRRCENGAEERTPCQRLMSPSSTAGSLASSPANFNKSDIRRRYFADRVSAEERKLKDKLADG